jgi:ESCRT-II complex subunit VPS22
MRRKVGVSAVTLKRDEKDKYSKIGKSLEENKIAAVKDMTVKFKTTLTEFAAKHKDRINSDPEFRHQFHKMCLSVGVDPLASNKGFWADILGVGDFYFELGVKIIQISVQTRSANGGIMSLAEMISKLNANHNQKGGKHHHHLISSDDVMRAMEKIEVLGNGFQIRKFGGKKMILSVPMEISNDFESLMTVAQQFQGMVSFHILSGNYQWSTERFTLAIQPLLTEGIVWMDQYNGELSYYFPSIWKECLLDDDDITEEFSEKNTPLK